jgi:glutaredoxin
MNPPKCPHCGKVEWRHLCGGQSQSEIGRRFEKARSGKLPDFVTKPLHGATKPLHATPAVAPDATKPVACPECKRLRKALKEALAEIEALHGEVAMLKRDRAGGKERPMPMSSTERARKLRAKRKAEGQQQFEG